jgi:hypothetical protein
MKTAARTASAQYEGESVLPMTDDATGRAKLLKDEGGIYGVDIDIDRPRRRGDYHPQQTTVIYRPDRLGEVPDLYPHSLPADPDHPLDEFAGGQHRRLLVD